MEKAVTILGPMRFDRMSNIFCSALVLYSGTQNVFVVVVVLSYSLIGNFPMGKSCFKFYGKCHRRKSYGRKSCGRNRLFSGDSPLLTREILV